MPKAYITTQGRYRIAHEAAVNTGPHESEEKFDAAVASFLEEIDALDGQAVDGFPHLLMVPLKCGLHFAVPMWDIYVDVKAVGITKASGQILNTAGKP